jgi:hypothetical protein
MPVYNVTCESTQSARSEQLNARYYSASSQSFPPIWWKLDNSGRVCDYVEWGVVFANSRILGISCAHQHHFEGAAHNVSASSDVYSCGRRQVGDDCIVDLDGNTTKFRDHAITTQSGELIFVQDGLKNDLHSLNISATQIAITQITFATDDGQSKCVYIAVGNLSRPLMAFSLSTTSVNSTIGNMSPNITYEPPDSAIIVPSSYAINQSYVSM